MNITESLSLDHNTHDVKDDHHTSMAQEIAIASLLILLISITLGMALLIAIIATRHYAKELTMPEQLPSKSQHNIGAHDSDTIARCIVAKDNNISYKYDILNNTYTFTQKDAQVRSDDKQVIILLSGNCSSGRSTSMLQEWGLRNMMDNQRDIICIDAPGHGQQYDSATFDQRNLREYIEATKSVIEKAHTDYNGQVDVIGVSLGGMVASHAIAKSDKSVKSFHMISAPQSPSAVASSMMMQLDSVINTKDSTILTVLLKISYILNLAHSNVLKFTLKQLSKAIPSNMQFDVPKVLSNCKYTQPFETLGIHSSYRDEVSSTCTIEETKNIATSMSSQVTSHVYEGNHRATIQKALTEISSQFTR